ncbi:hypothetical protein CMV_003886 [Castanea mollissima]|uniref:F-box associated beta-propeller type 3 domain-containing protein n=1 Tax=Castanea mollissima TaxID=60419 RepID=A0A8J4VVU4_9ROSI|nr:hypothetical protein CMV_003886 [Castanea mollissima]
MEEYLSHHSGELQIGDSTIGPSGIGSNSQSLVELHNGHSVAIMGGGRSFEQAEKTIGGALLRRIKMVDSGKEISRPEGNGNNCEADKPVLFLHPNLDDDAADDDFDSRGIILESPFLEEPKQSEEIVGSCINGIICLKYCVEHNNIHDFALWNPAIRELKVLPSLPIHFPSNVDYEDVGSAFGYDSNSNDFKVITILSYWNDPGYTVPWDPSVIMHTHVEVYTLSTNSWRQVDCDTVSHINFPAPFGEIYLNGVYHWCGTAPGIAKDYDVIVSFDMRNEVFGILSTPNLSDILDPAYVWEALAVLGNCVALVVFDSRPTEKIFHILGDA